MEVEVKVEVDGGQWGQSALASLGAELWVWLVVLIADCAVPGVARLLPQGPKGPKRTKKGRRKGSGTVVHSVTVTVRNSSVAHQ